MGGRRSSRGSSVSSPRPGRRGAVPAAKSSQEQLNAAAQHADHRPQVDIDDERAMFQLRWYDEVDKDGNGSITLEDSIWAKPFLDAHDIDGDGRVTLVRLPTPLAYRALLLSCSRTANAQTARFYSA